MTARSLAAGVIGGLGLFIIGALVPYWDGGLPGGPEPPPVAVRRLIRLTDDGSFAANLWIFGWLVLLVLVLGAAALLLRPTARRLAAGFIAAQGAILVAMYLERVVPLWTSVSAFEPLALLWPIGAVVMLVAAFLAARTARKGSMPVDNAARLSALLAVGAGLIAVGHLVPSLSGQWPQIPITMGWKTFTGHQIYWRVILLLVVISGGAIAAFQVARSRAADPLFIGAGLSGSAWVLALTSPGLVEFGLNPYLSLGPGSYLQVLGAFVLATTTLLVWFKYRGRSDSFLERLAPPQE